jgi:hypothetical protein
MDTLVAQYGQPIFHSEAVDDPHELLQDGTTALNLKFAIPPITQVSVMFPKVLKTV